METLWFCLVAAMLVVYFVLDGYDLGAGSVHLLAARSEEERRLVLRSIGPLWDGNEVWLVAAGGTLYFAFPKLYAVGFSGFYLPLMIALWLLVLRGVSIELRNHVGGPIWRPFWDVVFSGASALLVFLFGAALGNVLRGVPIDFGSEHFFTPLWTDFRVGDRAGILDWYTALVGVFALMVLTLHGALWIAMKTEGALEERSRLLALRAWWIVLALAVVVTIATVRVQPQLGANLSARPWGYLLPAIAAFALLAARLHSLRRADGRAFLASSAFIAAMLASALFGIYPYVLPSSVDPAAGLTLHAAAAPRHGLEIGLRWWIPGMALATAYVVYVHRRFSGKVRGDREGY